jgi:NADH-quinone oxidoreductase subunit M
MHGPSLSLIVFGPVVLGTILYMTKEKDRLSMLEWALFASVVPFLYSLSLFWTYIPSGDAFQLITRLPFIVIGDKIRIEYFLGVDGISLFLVLLTTFLTPIAIISTYKAVQKNYREFLFMLLALETGILGTFLALDLILFYIFWEMTLIPMYFIIGVWGSGDRIRSAMKFVIFTMVGSVLMLVAILVVYSASASKSFDITHLYGDTGLLNLARSTQMWLFWAFFLAFAIKVPLFPLHTWLPDAHTDAPTAGSVILAGILLKMGAYGLLRFCLPLFPDAAHSAAGVIVVLAVIGIIYGAWVATVQRDVKRLVAYSSVSHLGLVVLGIFTFTSDGGTGAVLQMVNHGLTTGALFLMVGMLYERRHTRQIEDFGGLMKVMPMFSVIFWIILFASIGLPPLNGFIGELLIFLGVFQVKSPFYIALGCLAVSGIIWGAIYMLWMYQRVMQGKITHDENRNLLDLDHRELGLLIPILIMVFAIGLYSPIFTNKIGSSVTYTLKYANATSWDAASNVPSKLEPKPHFVFPQPENKPVDIPGKTPDAGPQNNGLVYDPVSGAWRQPDSGGVE